MAEKSVTGKIIDVVTGISTFLALIALFAMMLLITCDVTLNKLADRPIPGTIELTTYYFMVLVVFFTLPYIEKKQAHISADFIVVRFREKYRNMFNIFGKLLTVLFYSLLAYGAIMQAIKSTRRLETVMSNFTFYIWPARWGVVLGLVSAILIIIVLLVQRFKDRSESECLSP